jgi:hypothetical protein
MAKLGIPKYLRKLAYGLAVPRVKNAAAGSIQFFRILLEIQKRRKGRKTMLILIIVLLLVFGVGGGYYGHSRWGPSGGAGIGVGTILLILLIAYMLGLFH